MFLSNALSADDHIVHSMQVPMSDVLNSNGEEEKKITGGLKDLLLLT